MTRILRLSALASSLSLVALLGAGSPGRAEPAAAAPAPPDRSEVQFRIGEPVLLDWLRAVTPYTVTVGTPPLSTDLIFSEPRDLALRQGQATFKVRLRGRPLAVDQILAPVIAVRYEPQQRRYLLVVSKLEVQVPGLGTLDLKSYFPRLEFPSVLQNLWRSGERPYGLDLVIRRVQILDHAVEIGADANFTSSEAP